MGTVFLASTAAGLCVVKHLRGDLAMQPSFLQSFLDEAKLAMRLHHPNVVVTSDVGFDGARYFLEMEYLDGQTLDALVRRYGDRDVPRPLALHVVSEILAALDYAHELRAEDGSPLSVVHRDVSPHNVMVTYEGAVKLLDFGIAKAADATSDTTTGVVKGKLTYMSPEQATRAKVDRRADLFAVGVILWQLLTGRRLWQGVPEVQIFHKLDRGEIERPREVRPDVPEALDAVCMKALARSPDDRFATAAEMRAALEEQIEALGARATERDAAAAMTELFVDERASIEAQIARRLAGDEDPGVAGPPPLAAMQERGATQSGATLTPSVPRGALARTGDPSRSGTLRRTVIGALGVAAVALGVVWVTRGTKVPVPASSSSPSAIAVPARCATNAACVKEHGGRPFVCRKSDGACVSLESPRCKVIAEPGDVENDATIWLGTMFPTSGPLAEQFGRESQNAAELARRDFVTIARGVPYLTGDRPPRPLGLVACDDAEQPIESARHLVELRVPAVIGFSASQEVIDLAGAVFIPNGIVAMATQNQSPLLSTIPHPPGSPRMVWRTTVSSAQSVAPTAALLERVVEPMLAPALKPGEVLRVLLLRVRNTAGLSISEVYFNQLRWNGKSALANGDAYRDAAFDFPVKDAAPTVEQILSFQPHVILLPGVTQIVKEIVAPVEERWPAARPRPRYIVAGYVVGDDFFTFLGRDDERRLRFLGVTPSSATPANAKLMNRYNEVFSPKVPRAATPGAVYDAMYAVAYGIFALGDAVVDGRALSAQLPRFSSIPAADGGRVSIEVGPTKIFDVFGALRAGRPVDLDGAATRLDFDPETGDTSSDFSVLCVEAGPDGRAREAVASNVVYRGSTGKLEGLPLRCR